MPERDTTGYRVPPPGYIEVYDHGRTPDRRQVLKREPKLTCYCGKEHAVKTD